MLVILLLEITKKQLCFTKFLHIMFCMKTMRLDKFLSETKTLTRKQADIEIKKGNIKINGKIAKKKDEKVLLSDIIEFNNEVIKYEQFVYFMINKPIGYVSSTDDPRDKTVLELLPQNLQKYNLFPCGRLDKETVGLIILTNDGVGSHALLSPKKHITKEYYFEVCDPVSDKSIKTIEQGIVLRDGYKTKPCTIKVQSNKSGIITLTEGKYHEIRRLFASQGNKVCYLKRISFGSIKLDPNLNEGDFRPLTSEEILLFEKAK